MSNLYFLGINIGVLKTSMGLVTFDGIVADKIEENIELNKFTKEIVIEKIIANIEQLLSQNGIYANDLLGIGVAVPGPTDSLMNKIYFLTSVKGWENFDLWSVLNKKFPNIPIAVENNSNAFTFGEFWKGAAVLEENVFGITVGLGVGGGIIQNGKILRGHHGLSAEIGHLTITPDGDMCICGNKGCLELYISIPGLINFIKSNLEVYQDSKLADYISNVNYTNFKLKDIYDIALKNDDRLAKKTIYRFTNFLSIGIANVINLLDPNMIVLGGHIFDGLGEDFLNIIRDIVKTKIFKKIDVNYEITFSELGDEGLIIGAAGISKLALKTLNWGA